VKARYGDGLVKAAYRSSDESSSSEEDEYAEHLTQELEKDFFRTLSCLKKRDPSIYDEKVSFFASSNSTKTQGRNINMKKNETRPLFLRDYERKLIVERGQLSDDGMLLIL
jgi:protein KRI1